MPYETKMLNTYTYLGDLDAPSASGVASGGKPLLGWFVLKGHPLSGISALKYSFAKSDRLLSFSSTSLRSHWDFYF